MEGVIAHKHFRRGGEGREPILAPGDVSSLSASYTTSQQYWGKVTSKRPPKLSRSDLELTAFRLGCSVETARQAILAGLFDD